MDSFRKGLGMLGVLSLCQKYPQQLQCLFVYKETKVQFSTFEKLIIVPDEKDERKTEVFEWFLMYLKARESEETGIDNKRVLCCVQFHPCPQCHMHVHEAPPFPTHCMLEPHPLYTCIQNM